MFYPRGYNYQVCSTHEVTKRKCSVAEWSARRTRNGRYFIYDYYYVPKHTYHILLYIISNIPIHHHTPPYTAIHHHTPPYITINLYTFPYTPIHHHTPLYITMHPYTSPYTSIQHYIPLYIPIHPYTFPYTPIQHHILL